MDGPACSLYGLCHRLLDPKYGTGQQGCSRDEHQFGCYCHCHGCGLWDIAASAVAGCQHCHGSCGSHAPQPSSNQGARIKWRQSNLNQMPRKDSLINDCFVSKVTCCDNSPPYFVRHCNWGGMRRSRGCRSNKPWCCYRARKLCRLQWQCSASSRLQSERRLWEWQPWQPLLRTCLRYLWGLS